MNKKFFKILSEKCKDMGLTDKALEELATLGSKGLADDATDDDINKAVDSLVPYAKAMQGEITRKTRKQSVVEPSTTEGDDKEGEHNNGDGTEMPNWFKPFQEQLTSLQEENKQLKAEKANQDRQTVINAKAKELGIPDYLVKRMSFAEDADIDKELNALKQDLVTNNLMQKEQAHELGGRKEAMEADAKAWAESLPNA